MSATTTLLAWLIPCFILAIAFIAWRVYVYKTQGPFLPESLRRNVFARTRSMIPRTLSFNSNNKDAPGTLPTTNPGTATTTRPAVAGGAVRNETRIDIPSAQPPMSSIPAAQSFSSVPCDRKTPSTPGSIATSGEQQQPAPVSPAVARLIAMK
ncbi:MAG: hypothetical protein J3R72DRAFT_441055 [Linnemannia gamsii]|nr:MAG: hypothetical protein J3R72DRAFT_441055 [Linnemannia gamsii]